MNNVEAALEAAFGLGYMLAGLLLVGFFVLLDSAAATTLFCSPLDDADLGSLSELQRAHLSQEAAEVYALRGLQHMSQGTSASRGASSVPRYPPSAGDRDQSGSLFAPDGASKVRSLQLIPRSRPPPPFSAWFSPSPQRIPFRQICIGPCGRGMCTSR